MAKKSDFGVSFVRYQLTEKDKQEILALTFDLETMSDWLFGLAQDGYKFSMSYSDSNDSFIGTLTGKNRNTPNYNLSYSAFHSNPFRVYMILYYVHELLSNGDWTSLPSNDADW